MSADRSFIPGNSTGWSGHLRLHERTCVFRPSHHRREEFDRTALVYAGELLRVAARLCGNADTAEDLVQETYLQAWRSFHRFETGTNCRAWLYKILLFTYAGHRRKRARQPFLIDLDEAGESALLVDVPTPDTLTADAVKAAFDRLPDPFRTLVLLVDVEGLTYREAADALEVPIGTVMSRLSRGRRLLRLELAGHAPAGGHHTLETQRRVRT
jgi:RNA polymerase sigma-70 factor, ECF subfamily